MHSVFLSMPADRQKSINCPIIEHNWDLVVRLTRRDFLVTAAVAPEFREPLGCRHRGRPPNGSPLAGSFGDRARSVRVQIESNQLFLS